MKVLFSIGHQIWSEAKNWEDKFVSEYSWLYMKRSIVTAVLFRAKGKYILLQNFVNIKMLIKQTKVEVGKSFFKNIPSRLVIELGMFVLYKLLVH